MSIKATPEQIAKWEADGLIPRITSAKPKRPPQTAPPRLLLEVDIPVRTVSEANTGGRIRAKCARKREAKDATSAALPRLADPLPLPVVVTLTRCGPGKLDDDNLRSALKTVRDTVAVWLGCDDADPRIKWRYRQRAAWVPFVRIRISHRGRQ